MQELLPSYSAMQSYFKDQFALSYRVEEAAWNQLEELHLSCEESLPNFLQVETLEPSVYFEYKGYQVPVFFTAASFSQPIESKILQFDVVLNAFLLLSGWQEWVIATKDKEGRFPFQCSLQHKFNFVEVPVVTIYFELLAEAMRKAGFVCDPLPYSKPIIFTHDIDQVRSGWFEDIGFYLKNNPVKNSWKMLKTVLGKVLGSKDSYWNAFEEMLALDQQHNTEAISFLMTDKSHQDADYQLKTLTKASGLDGQIIGLHPGYFTYNDANNFKRQLEELEQHFPEAKRIVRQHFLKYDVRVTNQIHEELAITEDYSLGFAERYGFRNSIATPFYLYRFDQKRVSTVLEVPLYFMDGTLFHYMKDRSWKGKQEVIQKIEKLTQDFNCQFSVLFHNSVFTENKYKGFKKMYEELIF